MTGTDEPVIVCERCKHYEKTIIDICKLTELHETLRGESELRGLFEGETRTLHAQVEQQNKTIAQLIETIKQLK